MSAVAQRPSRAQARSGDADIDPQAQYGAALAALAQVTAAASTGEDPRDTMRRLVACACDALAVARGAVYVRDEHRDLFVGCAAHPGAELEEAVRRLVLGGSADRITGEIVARRAPVLIRDTQSDDRARTGAVRTWKVRSLLGVPMIAGDELLGVLMFDNREQSHRFAPVDVEIASAFGVLGGSLLAFGRAAGTLRGALDTATRQNRLLRRTAVAEHRLADAILGGGGLGTIVELVCSLTGKPSTLYDVHGQAVCSSAPEGRERETGLLHDAADGVRACLDEVVPGASTTIEPALGDGVRRRHLAAPIDVLGDRWGWLVIVEHPARLAAFDDFLIRRAATHLALELVGRRQRIASDADARALLARQLLTETPVEGDLRRHGEYLGVAIDVPRVVALVTGPPGAPDPGALVEALRARGAPGVLASAGSDGVSVLVEIAEHDAPTRAARRVQGWLRGALGDLCPEPRIAGLSAVCRTRAELPAGHRMALQVARCVASFPDASRHRVVAADDLGPGRLFVANSRPEEMRRFVEDVLGRLLDDDEACAGLIRTLEAFYDTGRSVRLAAERLGVHENTVRYRLSRVHAITGLDVAGDADDQLSVQVALLVLRLEGHPGVRPLDDRLAGAPGSR